MRRGDIVWADFGPPRDSEAAKRRPAVVVSSDSACTAVERLGGGVLVLVPLTSNTDRIYPFQVLFPGDRTALPRTSKAQVEQLRAVSIHRISDPIARTPPDLLDDLDDALRLHLAL